jgi:hypothetical protein
MKRSHRCDRVEPLPSPIAGEVLDEMHHAWCGVGSLLLFPPQQGDGERGRSLRLRDIHPEARYLSSVGSGD